MRIGIIGAGTAATMHSRAIQSLHPEMEQFVFDINPEVAVKFANAHNVICSSNLHDFWECIDAVVISTPVTTHSTFVKEALRRKKHILCEKPMALNTNEAQEMLNMCREYDGVVCSVGFNYRYFAITRLIKESKLIGEIKNVNLMIRRLYRNDWHNSYNGVLSDLGIHLIDLLFFICNQSIDFSTCTTIMKKKEDWDYDSQVSGQMTNGVNFYISASRITNPLEVVFSINIEGEAGSILYDSRQMSKWTLKKGGIVEVGTFELSYTTTDFFDFTDSISLQDFFWIKSINNNRNYYNASFEDGLNAQRALDYFIDQATGT